MDEIEEKLVSYIKEMNIAKATISQLKGIDLDSMEMQLSLCEKLNIESMQPIDLLDKALSRGIVEESPNMTILVFTASFRRKKCLQSQDTD